MKSRRFFVPKILVVSPSKDSPFVLRDVSLISKHYPTEFIAKDQSKGSSKRLILRVLKRVIFNKFDVCIMWFSIPEYSSVISLLSRLFGKKVVIISGGGDIVYFPDLGFGALSTWKRVLSQRISFNLASRIISFSKYSVSDIAKLARNKDVSVIYMAVDGVIFKPKGKKEKLVLTVCFEIDKVTIRQKGLETFVKAASFFPGITFMVVGRPGTDGAFDQLKKSSPRNVQYTAKNIRDTELIELYQKARVYVQASLHEGFGVAVAESMACGCVPVVADNTAMPEVVDGAGYIAKTGDVGSFVGAIKKALNEKPNVDGRQRVLDQFNFELREKLLIESIKDLWKSKDIVIPDSYVRVDLGCGGAKEPGFIGIDNRKTPVVDIVADARKIPLKDNSVDYLRTHCLLEHFENPSQVIDEVHRILKTDGILEARLPNIGTYSAHLDITHKFLADLSIWKSIFKGYFSSVKVIPLGTKYRDSKMLQVINWFLVSVFGFKELAQGWDFICSEKLEDPKMKYSGWWLEGNEHSA